MKASLRSESPSVAGPGLRATGRAVAVVTSVTENALRAFAGQHLAAQAHRVPAIGIALRCRHVGSSTKNVGSSSIV